MMIERTELHYTNRINKLFAKGETMNLRLINKAKRNLKKIKK